MYSTFIFPPISVFDVVLVQSSSREERQKKNNGWCTSTVGCVAREFFIGL